MPDQSTMYFNIAEYCLFSILLGAFVAIIVYFLFVDKRNNDVSGLLFGGKNMSTWFLTFGLIASHITGITLLGVPQEIYLRGTQYWASALSIVVVSLLTAFIYLPVFHKMQLTSAFEYLEIRFSSHTRTIAAALFVISKLMLLPIVPYVPLLAFRNVTDSLAGRIAALVCTACATLCAISGLRAIVAVSVVTTLVACGATALSGGLATLSMGFRHMWDIADEGGRLVLYDPDPELEHHTSFFAVTLAMGTNWLWKVALSQATMQKLLAVPTINQARICLMVACAGVVLVKLLSCFLGLAMYAWFAGCDPLLSGRIRRREEMVALFLNNLSALFPGICGVFLTGIFSATACCMASIINSISGVMFEDFIRPWMPRNSNEFAYCTVIKILCTVCGFYCAVVLWLAPNMDKLQAAATGVSSVTIGTLLGLFTLGIVSSRANCAGALSGAMVSLLLCGWLLLEAENALLTKRLFFQDKPLLTTNCTGGNLHVTSGVAKLSTVLGATPSGKKQSLFRISYTYCTFAGALTVFLVGMPMSYLTKSKTADMNPDIFCPLTQSLMHRRRSLDSPERGKSKQRQDDAYLAIDEALKHLKEIMER